MSAALAQLVRAPDCGSGGPPFEPGRRYHPPVVPGGRLAVCAMVVAPIGQIRNGMLYVG